MFILTFNKWESEFFNKNIWKLERDKVDNKKLSLPVGLITVKVPCNNYEQLEAASSLGMQIVEGEVTLSSCIDKDNVSDFSLATHHQLNEILSLTDDLFKFSRFRSPWFNDEEKNRFYREWVSNSINTDFADDVVIFVNSEGIQGFCSIKIYNHVGVIGLLGVSEKSRGKGIGSSLIKAIKGYCVDKGCDSLRVTTQLSNMPAINLYQKNGFLFSESHYWLYKKVIKK